MLRAGFSARRNDAEKHGDVAELTSPKLARKQRGNADANAKQTATARCRRGQRLRIT
jgi:hypothetical protein